MIEQKRIFQLGSLILLMLLVSCAGLFGPDIKPAQKLSAAGKYADALKEYEAIIEAGEANAKVYRLAYETAFQAGKRVTAESYYDRAIEEGFDTDSMRVLAVQLWYGRALMVMGKGQWDEATKASEAISALAPDSREDTFCRLLLAGKRKYDRGAHKGLWDAVADYTKAANLDPSTGLPHFLMGQARFKNDRNDYDAALEDYYESVRLEPEGLFADEARADIKKIEATKAKMKAFWGK